LSFESNAWKKYEYVDVSEDTLPPFSGYDAGTFLGNYTAARPTAPRHSDQVSDLRVEFGSEYDMSVVGLGCLLS
jgi:hypothetical protein